MLNRAFRGVWIPKEIWINKELTLQEKTLITEIDSLDNDDGCFASNKYFANFMDVSERQIKRVIQNLIAKRWISSKIICKKNSKEVDKRILRICRPPYPKITPSDKNDTTLVTELSKGSDKDVTTPGDKNVLDNNTYINNTINNTNNNNNNQQKQVLLEHFEKIWKEYPNKKRKG